MLLPFCIRNIVAILTKVVTIEAFLFSANFFCYSNSLSSARVVFFTSKGKDKIDDKCFAMRCETGNGVNNNDTDLETMNKNLTEFVYLLPNETTAWHMGGSSNQRAERRDKDGRRIIKKYRTHKQQWMKETRYEWPSKCSTEGCTNVPSVGAHVVIDGKENVHLVPLCTNCNLDLSKNWSPDIKKSGEMQASNGFKLETGTPCLELNHISREESLVGNDPFSWIEMYDRLVLHIMKYNTTSIVFKSDTQLERWVRYQRLRYKTRIITSKEINLLDDIGFSWNPNSDKWDKNFALLKQYQEENEDCNVPYNYNEYGQNLGWWLNTQRQDKRNNKLPVEKEKQLEDLGVIWEPQIDKWEEHFKLLQQYKLKTGDCNVPQQYEVNGVNLGAWLNKQRQEKKKKKNAEKEKRLDDIGVAWEPLIDQWEENFKYLQQYKHKNGDCNVPQQYEEKGVNIGEWLTRQRHDKRYNKLNDEKEKRLDDLGVIWEPYLNQWEEKYELLEQFKNERGHCNVSGGQKEDKKYRALRKWLTKQRFYYRNGNLKDERLMKLNKLGVEWNLKKEKNE